VPTTIATEAEVTDSAAPADQPASTPTQTSAPDYQLEFETWLDGLDPLHATLMLQVLTTNPSWLGALRAERVHQLTRHESYDQVAAELGVGRDAIRKAVKAHNRRTTPPAP
jgi:hypothetical protein